MCFSCNNDNTTTKNNKENTAKKDKNDDDEKSVKSDYAEFTKSFEGSINGKYEIYMTLTNDNNELHGTYCYKTQKSFLKMSGTIDKDGNVMLNEFNDKGNITGMFKGELVGKKISGKWSKPDGSNAMPFDIVEVCSLAKTKYKILKKAKGEYALTSISGNMGANTMFDTYFDNGKWISSYSSNEGGTREGYDNELEDYDIDLLNSMKIQIDDKLNISFFANNKVIFESKFIDNAMDYRIKDKSSEELNEALESLYPSTMINENELVILAQNQISYTYELSGNFDILADDQMLLTYSLTDNTFRLQIFLGECCDNNTLTFEKK